MLSLGAKLFGSVGSGLTKRMAIGGLAGAILGDDGGDILMGAAIGALAPGRAATKGFLKEGKLFGKANATLGQWGKTASKMPWKRGWGVGAMAGGGIVANAMTNSKFVDQYYTSYYGAGPETERTLESIKGVGRATMVTGILAGGLYGATGISPISPFKAGTRGAMKVLGGVKSGVGALPGFGRGVMGRPMMNKGYYPGSIQPRTFTNQPGYQAGQRARAGAAEWSLLGRGTVHGRTVGGTALNRPFTNKLFGSRRGTRGAPYGDFESAAMGRARGRGGFAQKWKKAGWEFGGKGFNRLGAVGRHPYLAGTALGAAGGAAAGFASAGGLFNQGRSRQMQTGRGRIIGIDSGGGGMNPSLNFSTQGLGLNIHNRRRRRTLVD